MNILVCVKHVPDTETAVKIGADGKSIQTQDVNFILNPYDEFALEEALKIKEAKGGEVTLITAGPEEAKKSLRTGLAMGADKAMHILCDESHDSLALAFCLAEGIKDESFDLILCGKQAMDEDNAQVPIMLADKLGLPNISAVIKLEIGDGTATAHREFEGGTEVVETSLPAVISAHKGLNEPRYASLKGIMMAKKKEIKDVSCTCAESGLEILDMAYPPSRAGGRIVGEGTDAVPELVKLLREEAKVI
ncbi:electron transfer flavoprotein subunit beta [candidate division LCP-89 bacterium B3_LCP]|uniref:Electron transfer flavoprotein subunit beta n=1 Tax=candidate division LCP-89 bacterium B3_LCP TaxID=2012998 RepID=A0A532UVR2_UNCL8|nr:MAG: electron transfer flavoprotein subunit beta [candidate division LCP-89 bacterium B3_LCP]